MDDFFLPPSLRTSERLKTPGGNVHYERFLKEVSPYLRGGAFSYNAYDCKSRSFYKKHLPDARLTVVEGSYSLHPSLLHLYDLKLFCDIKPPLQAERVKTREGVNAALFFEKWIPLEEAYFKACNIKSVCDLVIKEF